jgi:ADP-ribosylglycohydrolase
MSTQESLLFDSPPPESNGDSITSDRFEGAMVFSAIGDALGWPTEFLRDDYRNKTPFDLPLKQFVGWHKMVGGRFWGYRDFISPGSYSDDTQLSLAVARSISSKGEFQPETFAYAELPLWLNYERGGGRSIKAAARSLVQKNDWLHNFYKVGEVDYRQAGANGAAMRNLPIALASSQDEKRLIRDSFYNAVITHGHPRAILGTLLYGLAVRYALQEKTIEPERMTAYLLDSTALAGRLLADDQKVHQWVIRWEMKGNATKGFFKESFNKTHDEARHYLQQIKAYLDRPTTDYYDLIGARKPETKGSGLATVCAAIFQFIRPKDRPEEQLYDAVNSLGTDTDTIATFLGALLGAHHGLKAIPHHLSRKIQDRQYLQKIGRWLHAVGTNKIVDERESKTPLDRSEALANLLAWDIGLHEMFWDAIDVGGIVAHPTLGRGEIIKKDVRPIARAGYVMKLIQIAFDCGQTCFFHSRVEDNGKVAESLGQTVQNLLHPTKEK